MKISMQFLAIIVVLMFSFLSCAKQNTQLNPKPLIVTTIYPYELIIKELVDTLFTVETLLPPNASPHTWSPSPQDMLKLEKADVVISNGLGLETNLSKALNQLGTKHIVASSFIDHKLLISEPEKHHHEAEANKEEHHHEGEPNGEEHHHEGANPHIWTSPETLTPIIIGLSNELSKRYPMNKSDIETKARLMIMEINRVDGKIKTERAQFNNPAIITLHDAFVYFLRSYEIEFIGSLQPSAGKDPAPQQLKILADKIKKKKIKTIFIEPQMNPKPAETLAQELKLKVLKYDDLGTSMGAKTISEFLWLNWEAIKTGL